VLVFVVHPSRVCVLSSVLSGNLRVSCPLTHLALRRRKLVWDHSNRYLNRCNADAEDYGYYQNVPVLNVAECCSWLIVRDQGVVFLTRARTCLFVRFTFLPAHSQSSHFLASALLAPSLSFSCSCYIAIGFYGASCGCSGDVWCHLTCAASAPVHA
jgi:hypothetical protein